MCQSNLGYAYKKMPSAKMIALRFTACSSKVFLASPRPVRAAKENTSDTPTIKRKNGKIRSVGVQPFHAACSSGQYVCFPSPELLTRIMAAIVIPRNTSRDVRRAVVAGSEVLTASALGERRIVVDT